MLFPTLSRTMTAQDFAEGAANTVMPFNETLGQSILSGIDQSFGLGTALRDVQTPPLAIAPRADGQRFGYRVRSPEEVAAQGDTLYNTPEEYKASPYYRETVPFEPGMTESRARALAGYTDLATVRDYWSSKRPYTSFAGHLIGQAFDPLNYIPIFGEAEAPAVFGRVVGRAFMGSAEAATNTALAGAFAAPERAHLGYDTSWESLAGSVAFAAMAGGVVGGIHGYFSPRVDTRLPETQANRTKASIVLNEAIDTHLNEGEVRLGENAQAILNDTITAYHGTPHNNFTNFSSEKIGTGEGNASFGHGLYFAQEKAVGEAYKPEGGSLLKVSIATTENKLIDNDKPLSQQTPEVKAALAKAATDIPKTKRFADSVAKFQNQTIRKFMIGTGATDPMGGSFTKMLGDVLGGEKQAAEFLKNHGVPGIKYLDQGSRIGGEGTRNFVIFDDKIIKTLEKNGQRVAALPRIRVKARSQPVTDYASPPPEPKADPKPAETRVASVQSGDPVKAQLDSAKAMGVDPETGKHDLEPEIQQLRDRGVLTEADEAALRAGDETVDAAQAWGDVLEAARMCVKE